MTGPGAEIRSGSRRIDHQQCGRCCTLFPAPRARVAGFAPDLTTAGEALTCDRRARGRGSGEAWRSPRQPRRCAGPRRDGRTGAGPRPCDAWPDRKQVGRGSWCALGGDVFRGWRMPRDAEASTAGAYARRCASAGRRLACGRLGRSPSSPGTGQTEPLTDALLGSALEGGFGDVGTIYSSHLFFCSYKRPGECRRSFRTRQKWTAMKCTDDEWQQKHVEDVPPQQTFVADLLEPRSTYFTEKRKTGCVTPPPPPPHHGWFNRR